MDTLINISNTICSKRALTIEDGTLLFDVIKKHLEHDKKVVLSFNGIELIGNEFLNISIGQLYGVYKEDFIKEHLAIDENINEEYKELLKRVVDTAKLYYKEKESEVKKFNYKESLLKKYSEIEDVERQIAALESKKEAILSSVDNILTKLSVEQPEIYSSFELDEFDCSKIIIVNDDKIIKIIHGLDENVRYDINERVKFLKPEHILK